MLQTESWLTTCVKKAFQKLSRLRFISCIGSVWLSVWITMSVSVTEFLTMSWNLELYVRHGLSKTCQYRRVRWYWRLDCTQNKLLTQPKPLMFHSIHSMLESYCMYELGHGIICYFILLLFSQRFIRLISLTLRQYNNNKFRLNNQFLERFRCIRFKTDSAFWVRED